MGQHRLIIIIIVHNVFMFCLNNNNKVHREEFNLKNKYLTVIKDSGPCQKVVKFLFYCVSLVHTFLRVRQ